MNQEITKELITTIIVRFPVKPDRQPEFQTELDKLISKLRQEESFVEARVHRDLEEPNTVVLYETYQESRESFLSRVPKQSWFKVFLHRLPNLLIKERDVFWHQQIESYDQP